MEKETEQKSSHATPTRCHHQRCCSLILLCACSDAPVPHPPYLPLFPFLLNKHPLQSPLFNPPVSSFSQSSLTAAQLTSPLFTHPTFLPLCHHSSLQKGVIYQKCNGGRRPLGQEGGCKKRRAGER